MADMNQIHEFAVNSDELSTEEKKSECGIILFPEFATLKEEIEKLRTELSMLLLERDELKYVECKNIEMQNKHT